MSALTHLHHHCNCDSMNHKGFVVRSVMASSGLRSYSKTSSTPGPHDACIVHPPDSSSTLMGDEHIDIGEPWTLCPHDRRYILQVEMGGQAVMTSATLKRCCGSSLSRQCNLIAISLNPITFYCPADLTAREHNHIPLLRMSQLPSPLSDHRHVPRPSPISSSHLFASSVFSSLRFIRPLNLYVRLRPSQLFNAPQDAEVCRALHGSSP